MEVEYWVYTGDDYDNRYLTVDTDNEEVALAEARKIKFTKNHKIYGK
jgi:hypothetical protein